MDRVTNVPPQVQMRVSVFPIVLHYSTSNLLAHAKTVAPLAQPGAYVQQTATYVPLKEETA